MLFVLYSPILFKNPLFSQQFLEVDVFCSIATSSLNNKNQTRDSGTVYGSPRTRQPMRRHTPSASSLLYLLPLL
jgi:hypothetical protein